MRKFVYFPRFYEVATSGQCEINLVYEDNIMLTDVASMINELSDYTVPVNIVKNGMQNAYCGSGYLLNTMGIGLKGLKHQLRSTYEHLI